MFGKSAIYILLGAALVAGFVIVWRGYSPEAEPSEEIASRITLEGHQESDATSGNTVSTTAFDTSSVTPETGFTAHDLQDMEHWHRDDLIRRGYETRDYSTYSDETLESLAEAGDVIAMKVMALRYSGAPPGSGVVNYDQLLANHAKKNAMIEKSVIYGDRELLSMMPGYHETTSRLITATDPKQKREATIEALAYTEFMGLRGDLGTKYNEQISFFKVYKEFGAPSHLSEQDKIAIRKRAREIYDGYEQKRLELGLGPFDNSIPEGKAKQFEAQKQLYLEKIGDNAM